MVLIENERKKLTFVEFFGEMKFRKN